MLTKIRSIVTSWTVFGIAAMLAVVNQWTFTVNDNTWVFDSRTEAFIALIIIILVQAYEVIQLKFTNKEVN